MKRFLLIAMFAVCACTSPTENEMRGQPCNYDLDCGEALLCAEFVCETACQLEGDCDRGYACEGSICVPTCEAQSDCERGTCSPRDNAEAGKACHVGYLPSCAMGCAEDEVCEFGQCAPRCLTDSECPPGLDCVTSYADSGSVCLVSGTREDPRDPGPDLPVVDTCTESERPHLFCDTTLTNEAFCGLDGECYSQPDSDVVFVVRDQTPFENCDDSVNGLEAPGADIRTIKLWDFYLSGEVIAEVTPRRYHPIPSVNDFADQRSLQDQADSFSCEEIDASSFLSLTCGGSLVFQFLGFGGPTIQAPHGFEIEIREYNGTCGMSNLDRYDVGICSNTSAVLNGDYREDCVFLEPDGGSTSVRLLTEAFARRE